MRGLRVVVAILTAASVWPAVAAADGPFQYYPLTPCRIVDTRAGNGGVLHSWITRTFTVKQAGSCGVPSDAKAATLNVTVVGPTDNGWVALWPSGVWRPAVSTLNFLRNEYALANGAVVPLGSQVTEDLSVYVATSGGEGTVHLLLDVTGYFR